MTVTVLVGNPKPRSRTWEAAHRVARELTGAEPDVAIDLADFGPALLDWSDAAVAEAVAGLATTDLLVVASPTYKGTYSGLLKLFLLDSEFDAPGALDHWLPAARRQLATTLGESV